MKRFNISPRRRSANKQAPDAVEKSNGLGRPPMISASSLSRVPTGFRANDYASTSKSFFRKSPRRRGDKKDKTLVTNIVTTDMVLPSPLDRDDNHLLLDRDDDKHTLDLTTTENESPQAGFTPFRRGNSSDSMNGNDHNGRIDPINEAASGANINLVDDSTIGDSSLGTYNTHESDNNSISSRKIGRLNKKKRALFKKLSAARISSTSIKETDAIADLSDRMASPSFQAVTSPGGTKSYVRTNLLPSRNEVASDFFPNEDDEDGEASVDPWSPNSSKDLDKISAFDADPFANFDAEAVKKKAETLVKRENLDEKLDTIIDISLSRELNNSGMTETEISLSAGLPNVGSDVRVNSSSDQSLGSRLSSIGESLDDGFDEPLMHIAEFMKLSEGDRIQAYCDLFTTAASMMKDVDDKREEIFTMGSKVDDLYKRVLDFEGEKKRFISKDAESKREIQTLQNTINDQKGHIDFTTVESNTSANSRQNSEANMLRTELEAKDVIIDALKQSVEEWKTQDQQFCKRGQDENERMEKMEEDIVEKDHQLNEQGELLKKTSTEIASLRTQVEHKEKTIEELRAESSASKEKSKSNDIILASVNEELESVKRELKDSKELVESIESDHATKLAEIERVQSLINLSEDFCKSTPLTPTRETIDSSIPVGTVRAKVAIATSREMKSGITCLPVSMSYLNLSKKKPTDSPVRRSLATFGGGIIKVPTFAKSDTPPLQQPENKILQELREKETIIKELEDSHKAEVNTLRKEKREIETHASTLEKELMDIKSQNTSDTQQNTAPKSVELPSKEDASMSKIESLRNEKTTLSSKVQNLEKEIEDVSGLLQETILSIKGWNDEMDDQEVEKQNAEASSVGVLGRFGSTITQSVRRVTTTQYTDEEVRQLEKLAKIHQLSVMRQREKIRSLEEELNKSTSTLEQVLAEANLSEEKVSVLETQFAALNKDVENNANASSRDAGVTSGSIIKIDAAHIISMEAKLNQNKGTIIELKNKIRKLKERNLSLRATIKPEEELRAQFDGLRLELQAKNLEIIELERLYKSHNNGNQMSSRGSNSSLSGSDVAEDDDASVDELRRILAKREKLILYLKNKLSDCEHQSVGQSSAGDLRRISLIQEMQDAIIRRLNILMNKMNDSREGAEGDGEVDEFTTPSKYYLISMTDRLSLLHDYQQISLHLLQSRISNEIESVRTGTKPIEMDKEVTARFDRTLKAIHESKNDVKTQLARFDIELSNHQVKLAARSEVIGKLLQSDNQNSSKVEVLQKELNEYKGLSTYSSVNAGVMARFKQCSELEEELEEKERVILRLNNVISEYRSQGVESF